MKAKTSELIDLSLDYAVAESLGMSAEATQMLVRPITYEFKPSTNWAQGGPIIEREDIRHDKFMGKFYTWLGSDPEGARNPRASGSTLLVAAMRCYVEFKLGEEVEIPDELL